MNDGIINEIQKECLDTRIPTSEILRKAYVVATKLSLEEIKKWCKDEMDGYEDKVKEVPQYRKLDIVYKAFNPVRGWIPVMIPSKSDLKFLLQQPLIESIVEIEELVDNVKSTISFLLKPEVQEFLTSNDGFDFEIRGFINPNQLRHILQIVRSRILDWTLELEKNGILGIGLNFSKDDREKAKSIQNNYGVIINGDVTGASIIGKVNRSTVENIMDFSLGEEIYKVIKLINDNKDKIELNRESLENIINMQEEIRQELVKGSPNSSRIKEILSTLKSIFENVVGNVIASGIVYEISKLLPKI